MGVFGIIITTLKVCVAIDKMVKIKQYINDIQFIHSTNYSRSCMHKNAIETPKWNFQLSKSNIKKGSFTSCYVHLNTEFFFQEENI